MIEEIKFYLTLDKAVKATREAKLRRLEQFLRE
jgi:hypothetical protein